MKKTFFLLFFIMFLTIEVSANAAAPFVFDGKEFSTQEELDAYKEERAEATLPDGTKIQIIDEKWKIITRPSALGDRDLIIIFLEPDFGEKGNMGIRCKDNSTEIIFNVGEYMGSESSLLEYKIGDSPIVKATVNPSTDGGAFFIRNPIQFLKKLSGEKKLALRFKPYKSSSIERVFNIEGIEKIIEPIERACNWKLKK